MTWSCTCKAERALGRRGGGFSSRDNQCNGVGPAGSREARSSLLKR